MAAAYPGAPHRQAGKRCWLLVWPGPSGQNGFQQPGAHSLYLPLNPDIQLTRAVRTTATQTIQGAWVDNFGLGIGTLTLSGHTGWAAGQGSYNGQPVNGFEAYQALWYDIMEYYFARQSQQATQPAQVTMQFSNDVDEMFFDVMPASTPNPWTIQRSKVKPYLYQYTLSLTILRDNMHPGAVSPIADPLDPLIAVNPSQAVSDTIINFVNVTPNPVATALPARTQTYLIQPGDTLSGIAVRYGATPATLDAVMQAIAHANGITNENLIFVGQVLTIPQPLP